MEDSLSKEEESEKDFKEFWAKTREEGLVAAVADVVPH